MNPIKVVIADDLQMFLEGLEFLLSKEQSIKIIGSVSNGEKLLDLVESSQPDVVVADIEMPVLNGIEATRQIVSRWPSIGVVALTQYEEDNLVVEMLEAGARAFVVKINPVSELVEAIEAVSKGQNYFCNTTSIKLTKMIANSRSNHIKQMQAETFSDKEREIIRLICEQYASKEIAPITRLSEGTVEKYRNKIMEKTGSRNVAGIVVYAIKNGLYKP
jgi:DNA-binding NarL/FixJ family response regulator